MADFIYTSNAWGYYHARDAITAESIAARICRLGFDGFDLLCGSEAVPACAIDDADERFIQIRKAAEEAGGMVASLVLVSFDLGQEDDAIRQLLRAPHLAGLLGAAFVHTLPRKSGITQDDGFAALERVWAQAGAPLRDAGLTVTAENHTFASLPDEDPFLIRGEADFLRMLDATSGDMGVKFDPAFLFKTGVEEEPLQAFARLRPYVRVVDLKDYAHGAFVKPGTGEVDFRSLAHLLTGTNVRHFSVEAEHHHFWPQTPTDLVEIDEVHAGDLQYYREIMGTAR